MVTLRAFKHLHMRCCSDTGLHGKKNQTSEVYFSLYCMLVFDVYRCWSPVEAAAACGWTLYTAATPVLSAASPPHVPSWTSAPLPHAPDTPPVTLNTQAEISIIKTRYKRTNSKEHFVSKSLRFTRTAFKNDTPPKNENSLIHCDGMRVSKWYDWLFSDKCKLKIFS